MRNLFKIIASLVLLCGFCFNSLMGITLNDKTGFSLHHTYSKSRQSRDTRNFQTFSQFESDNELILENEVEDKNETPNSESEIPTSTFSFSNPSLWSKTLLRHSVEHHLSLNILYCVLTI